MYRPSPYILQQTTAKQLDLHTQRDHIYRVDDNSTKNQTFNVVSTTFTSSWSACAALWSFLRYVQDGETAKIKVAREERAIYRPAAP